MLELGSSFPFTPPITFMQPKNCPVEKRVSEKTPSPGITGSGISSQAWSRFSDLKGVICRSDRYFPPLGGKGKPRVSCITTWQMS